MMKRRTREDQTVDERDGNADADTPREVAKHAACGRTVYVKVVADARVACWDHVRLSVDGKPDVTDESLIEDRVDRFTIVITPFR